MNGAEEPPVVSGQAAVPTRKSKPNKADGSLARLWGWKIDVDEFNSISSSEEQSKRSLIVSLSLAKEAAADDGRSFDLTADHRPEIEITSTPSKAKNEALPRRSPRNHNQPIHPMFLPKAQRKTIQKSYSELSTQSDLATSDFGIPMTRTASRDSSSTTLIPFHAAGTSSASLPFPELQFVAESGTRAKLSHHYHFSPRKAKGKSQSSAIDKVIGAIEHIKRACKNTPRSFKVPSKMRTDHYQLEKDWSYDLDKPATSQALLRKRHTKADIWPWKYRPINSSEIVCAGKKIDSLKLWLKTTRDPNSKMPAVDKQNGEADDMNSFIVDSESEDDITRNYTRPISAEVHDPSQDSKETRQEILLATSSIVVFGKHGCGKSAAIYAVAEELGYQIVEINGSSRRSGKDVERQFGDLTQSTLIQNKGAKLKPIFLLEDVEIQFEQDKGFWQAVGVIIERSRWPVILTTSDLKYIPSNFSWCDVLCMDAPSPNSVIKYLVDMASCEYSVLDERDIDRFYKCKQLDFRGTIMDLQFWCQSHSLKQEGEKLDKSLTSCRDTFSIIKSFDFRVWFDVQTSQFAENIEDFDEDFDWEEFIFTYCDPILHATESQFEILQVLEHTLDNFSFADAYLSHQSTIYADGHADGIPAEDILLGPHQHVDFQLKQKKLPHELNCDQTLRCGLLKVILAKLDSTIDISRQMLEFVYEPPERKVQEMQSSTNILDIIKSTLGSEPSIRCSPSITLLSNSQIAMDVQTFVVEIVRQDLRRQGHLEELHSQRPNGDVELPFEEAYENLRSTRSMSKLPRQAWRALPLLQEDALALYYYGSTLASPELSL